MMDIMNMKELVDITGGDLGRIYKLVKDMQSNRLHPGAIPCTFVPHRVQQSNDGVQFLWISSSVVWIQPVDVLYSRCSSVYMVRVDLDALSDESFSASNLLPHARGSGVRFSSETRD